MNNAGNKTNWFIIDGEVNGYTYIDDIVLEEVERCNLEEPCSPTDGYINPNWISYIDYQVNSDLVIDGLENVSLAENIRIHNGNGGVNIILPDKYCPNGIDYVHWNGRNSGGSALAGGWYAWEMDLYNDCDYGNLVYVFSIPNLTLYPPLGDNFECNQSIVQLLECCEAESNLFIENEIIEGAGEVYFHAVNNLTISNTIVKSTATNVIFKAGNEIILNPGFETEEGAIVDMIIEPCEENNPEKNDSVFTDNLCDTIYAGEIISGEIITPGKKEEIFEKLNLNKTTFFIFPNPANDYFELYVKYTEIQNYEKLFITITDISGKEYHKEIINQENASIYRDEINTSNYPSGIYFVNVRGNKFSETKKLVVK